MENPTTQVPPSKTDGPAREAAQSPEHPDPDNPPWGIWGALLLLLSSFALMALAQGGLVIPYALSRGVSFARGPFAEFLAKDTFAIVLALVGLVVAHLLTLVPAWFIVTRAGRYPFLRTLGWEWGGGLTFWRSALLAVLMLAAGMLILYFAGSPENEFERILNSSRAAALVAAFAATFTAPLVEEIVFRGLLYSALRRLVGAWGAVLLVFTLFAAIHIPQYWPSYAVIVTIHLLSLVLTVIRARTGKLLPCFVIHFIFNGIQSAYIVLAPYIEPSFIKTPAPDPALFVGLLLRLCGASC
ncbi:MAG TPA: type II CAAX endopeptidase family protein [Pyrinomonadaceae bacterium]